MYEDLAAAIRAEQPAALATVFEGPEELMGAKLLIRPGAVPEIKGTLHDADLDRVVARDVFGELSAGLDRDAPLRPPRRGS